MFQYPFDEVDGSLQQPASCSYKKFLLPFSIYLSNFYGFAFSLLTFYQQTWYSGKLIK